MVDFVIDGEPVAKGRPRFTMSGRAYTPKKTADYEKKVKKSYSGEPFPEGVPLSVHIDAYFQIPKSASKKRHEGMRSGSIRPMKTPDADNVAKSICDALNGAAYSDDKQVVRLTVEKWYSDVPRAEVRITEVKW